MIDIHEQCVKYGKDNDYVDYVKGANLAGFIKVANAMLDRGNCLVSNFPIKYRSPLKF